MKSRPVPERKPGELPRRMLHDRQVQAWVKRMLGDPGAVPADADEATLRFVVEQVMQRRGADVNMREFEKAMTDTTPVLAVPAVTDAVEDLGHITRQPEWQRFWQNWTVARRKSDAKRNVEGVKAVMATMAVPGYTSHTDSARELLVKMPSLREHFEALSANAGREFAIPSYQTVLRHMGEAPDLAPHLPRLTDDVHQLAQAATVEILKTLRNEFGYSEIGKRWLIDSTLVPGWAPQRGPGRGVMPEGLSGEAKKHWEQREKARWERGDAELRAHAPDMGFRAYTHGANTKNADPSSRQLGHAVRRGAGKVVRGLYHVVLVEQATGLVGVHATFDASQDEAPAIVPLMSDLLDLWPELCTEQIMESVAGDSAWDEDQWCRLLEVNYHVHPIFRWHRKPGGDRKTAARTKKAGRDARYPLEKGASREGDVIGRTGDGRLICAHHGSECIQLSLDRPKRESLKPGQENAEHKFRVRAQCLECARDAGNPKHGQKGIRAMFDWSNFTYYPHHDQGRPDLYAYRQAMLVRLNQAESAFAALKADNRTGAAGTDRPRIRFQSTYQALLSLAHLGRAALVIADQRQQREGGADTGRAGALLTPPPGTPSHLARSRKANPRTAKPAATTNPTALAIRNRGRATTTDPPAWAA